MIVNSKRLPSVMGQAIAFDVLVFVVAWHVAQTKRKN